MDDGGRVRTASGNSIVAVELSENVTVRVIVQSPMLQRHLEDSAPVVFVAFATAIQCQA